MTDPCGALAGQVCVKQVLYGIIFYFVYKMRCKSLFLSAFQQTSY